MKTHRIIRAIVIAILSSSTSMSSFLVVFGWIPSTTTNDAGLRRRRSSSHHATPPAIAIVAAADAEGGEVGAASASESTSSSSSSSSTTSDIPILHHPIPPPPPIALHRAAEIARVLVANFLLPMAMSSMSAAFGYGGRGRAATTTTTTTTTTTNDDDDDDGEEEGGGGWDEFWSSSISSSRSSSSNARNLARALESLGPTYVKFGQALGSRPDVVPPSLARALSSLQDDMEPFDNGVAWRTILDELSELATNDDDRIGYGSGGGGEDVVVVDCVGPPTGADLDALSSIASSADGKSSLPVAAASIGQVYRAHLPSLGDVAIKVRRPDVRAMVEADARLLVGVAEFLESSPSSLSRLSIPGGVGGGGGGDGRNDDVVVDGHRRPAARLINTRLASAAREFMSRIFEELDYRNEAANIAKFASLYSDRREDAGARTATNVSVVVPKVYLPWCTENVLVMEWIDGTKLTDVGGNGCDGGGGDEGDRPRREENLALVKIAIDATLNQLLVTGVLHADPHAGNLLKVQRDDGSVTLGYLDFGLLSTIPERVRDALVCSVALQVFERDVASVSSLFGELQLIPQSVLDDEDERSALEEALRITFDNSLLYPAAESSSGEVVRTAIPDLKFDKLLDSLSRLVPRFQFDLPPYFINNARALSTLEGIAKSLDGSFNVLTIMYPYALNRLLQNPSQSPIVERTLQSLIRSSDGKIDRRKIRRLLRDSASISGLSKKRSSEEAATLLMQLGADLLFGGMNNHGTMLVQTVQRNYEGYTKREVIKAKEARQGLAIIANADRRPTP
ncbi:hypothetical protein ACHAXA_003945 [Cyclostephanos tholiformis]|uniref:ABC1 atypical kinase-like domain-containing protein n=1 Tax=Cyclostephanos tholiformis TaxID=382380 RepID=A0ABD3RYP9_9STRA